ISFLHQSAQRAGILTALWYGDVRSQLENGINPIVIDVKGVMLNAQAVNVNKKRTRYRCAIGKETADYLLNVMVGHGLPYEGAYDKYIAEDIRKEYAKAEPYLTVMFNREIALRLEKEQLERKFQSTTGKKPEEIFPKYQKFTH